MSTWTWTFIKPEKLSKKQIKNLLEDAIKHVGGVYYNNYKKYGWDYELKDWLEFHKEEYDYFVNECDVSPEHMTEEYLTQELKDRIKICEEKEKYYQLVLDGKMKFREMLEKTNQVEKHGDFYIIKRQGDIYINIKYEWWRNSSYSEDEFCTVDSLINHLKQPDQVLLMDFKEDSEYHPLTPKLEEKLRKFYGNIGDNNFYVHFG